MPAIPIPIHILRGLTARDDKDGYVVIPTTYGSQHSSPQPGVVAGIVLGSVGGCLLFLALLYSCLGWAPVTIPMGGGGAQSETTASRSVLSFHRAPKKRRRTSGGGRATEMYEVRTHQHVEATRRGEPVVVSVPGPSRTATSTSRPAPRVVRESSDSEDEVVVIEEHSPPRRTRRQSGTRYSGDRTSYRRSESRRDSRRYSRDR